MSVSAQAIGVSPRDEPLFKFNEIKKFVVMVTFGFSVIMLIKNVKIN